MTTREEWIEIANAAAAEDTPATEVRRRSDEAPHWLLCPHRGSAIAEVSGSEACCGCASSRVHVYRCEQYGEPVLKQSDPSCVERLAAKVPGYAGRTCRECRDYS